MQNQTLTPAAVALADPFLRLQHMRQAYHKGDNPDLLVLDDISLDLKEGEIVGLLGRSGCGKSTLLRIIAGLILPTAGDVTYRGRSVAGPARGVAMVFQSFALFPWLTVLQNVEFGLDAVGVSEAERRRRALSAIDLIGLDGFESAYPKELSGGMRQRVGLARALVVHPDLLLMDEPFSALDVLTAETLRTDLIDLWIEGRLPIKSVLMVTHNIEEAVLMYDRVIVLSPNPGRVAREINIGLVHPRNRLDPQFRQRVDEIYGLMTQRPSGQAEVAETHAGFPGTGLGMVLPPVSSNRLAGLLEAVAAPPYDGRADLPPIAAELQMEVDELFPIAEVLQLLRLAELEGGDIRLTDAGRLFVADGTDARKRLFAERLVQHVPLAAHIRRVLDERPNHSAPAGRFLAELEDHMSEDYARTTLRAVVGWSRYAETFAYDEQAARFSLENPRSRDRTRQGRPAPACKALTSSRERGCASAYALSKPAASLLARRYSMRIEFIAAVLAVLAAPALAQGTGTPAQPAAPAVSQGAPAGTSNDGQNFGGPLWQRTNLLDDPGGLRSAAAAHGLTFGLAEAAEVLGNATGGTQRGAMFEGLLSMGVGLDTEQAGLWVGGTFNATAFQIHGRGLSFNNLDNNGNTVSSIEAQRGTLLFELWYEQMMFDKKLGIRVGQLAADQEFTVSQYAGLFINHTFGWSTLPSADLPSGGPAYPLATPGVRVRYIPREDWAFLLGVFNGDPAQVGPGGIPQNRDASGTAFRLNGGLFVIGEVQKQATPFGLAGTYKLGSYYNSNSFPDQRLTAAGLSLADPQNQPGAAGRGRRNNWSVYGVADQLLWRPGGAKDGGIGAFVRLQGAPGDRNLINFYVDAGVTWKGIVPGRDNDTAGIAFSLSRNSDTASRLDKDVRRLVTPGYPIRRHESVLELTYQAQVMPWLQVQPTAQYVFNLNGGIPNPANPAKRLGDAAVFGLRTNVTF